MDVDSLSENELIALNYQIVERLRILRQIRTHRRMLQFRIGERVYFEVPEKGFKFGFLTKFNRKSITIITDDDEKWNVSPAVVGKLTPAEPARPQLQLVSTEP